MATKTGQEWLLEATLRTLCNIIGLDPEKVKTDLAKMLQIIVGTGERLERLERQQLAIMRRLKISPEDENHARDDTEQRIAIEHVITNGSSEGKEFS